MPSNPLPTVSVHPQPFSSLLPHLLPLLPYSLPLVRRLQFHLSSPRAQTLATFPPTTPAAAAPPPSSWAACYVDRSRAPETQAWIFSTYELPPESQQQHPQNTSQEEARAQLLALLSTIAQNEHPQPHPQCQEEEGVEEEELLLILGSVHESLLPLLAGHEALPAEGPLRRPDVHPPPSPSSFPSATSSVLNGISIPFQKWLIPPPSPVSSSSTAKDHPLPAGYCFSSVHRSELGTVVASTSIPRSEATLAMLWSVCIRRSQDPGGGAGGDLVSWGFVGMDGSLSSL